MTESQQETEVAVNSEPLLGARLKAVREEKKLTIAEVASQLRLVRGNIELLEQGRWDQLHGRAYARGYLISYIKFLGLPETELLTAFDKEYSAAVNTPQPQNQQAKKSGLPASAKVGVFLLLLGGLAWYSYFLWQNKLGFWMAHDAPSTLSDEKKEIASESKENDKPPVPTTRRQDGEQAESERSDQSPDVLMTETEPAILAVPDTTQQLVEEHTVDSQPKADGDTPQTVISGETAQKIVQTVQEGQTQRDNALSQQEDEASTKQEKAKDSQPHSKDEAQSQPVLPPLVTVDLHFSDECWIKITDAAGKTLLNKLMPADSHQTVMGQAPLQFSVGRSSAVSMTVNGQAFDMTPYQKREVAHFTIMQPEL